MNEIQEFSFRIDNSFYSPKKPLIIAEAGTSHNGDLGKAKELIDAASDAGAQCVKFQIVFADEILHPKTGEVTLPQGKIKLYDRFKQLEMPADFYARVKEYAESKELLFICTPFGLKSASILKGIGPKVVKIASPELNYTGLLEEIAGWDLPVLLSSGVSTLSDIERAIEIVRRREGNREWGIGNGERAPLPDPHSPLPTPNSPPPHSLTKFEDSSQICLLHCVTSYPAPEIEYNLKVLPLLASIFGLPVGVSDHSADPELVPALSICMGASVIEKHFCLSKTDPGLDDPIALPPDEFLKMVRAVHRSAEMMTEAVMEHYKRERGEDLLKQIFGTGIKELAPSERANYRLTNRSIHAMRDIAAGEVLKKGDFAVLRTEKVLRPGLEPCWEKYIEGRAARASIPAGEGIRFEDI
jgi:sialic acid synthase SpsE